MTGTVQDLPRLKASTANWSPHSKPRLSEGMGVLGLQEFIQFTKLITLQTYNSILSAFLRFLEVVGRIDLPVKFRADQSLTSDGIHPVGVVNHRIAARGG